MAKLVKHGRVILKMIMEEAIKDPLGADLRVWDLMDSSKIIMDFILHHRDPIYIAFRLQGCEVGDLDHVRERCRVLGKPYAICKLSHDNRIVVSDVTIENIHSLNE